jgi:hypothetical protein
LNLSSKLSGLFFLGLSIAFILSASANTPPPASLHADFGHAVGDFKQGRRTAAYATFARLADQGDVESARVALMMYRHGEDFYGTAWGASQPQLDHWMALAHTPMERPIAESGD